MKAALKMAFRNILFNKMRSFLTMLGIIIGVTAVIMLVSIGQGASKSITDSIASMGADLLTVNITDDDVTVTEDELRNYINGDLIRGIAPVLSGSVTVKDGTSTTSKSIQGVTENYADVYGSDVQSGRFIMDSDVEYRTNVCVIGTDVAGDMFESYDVIGKTITIEDSVFTIVGLLEESGSSMYGSGDDVILVPLSTAKRLTGTMDVTQYYVAAADSQSIQRVESILNIALYQLTRDEDAYSVYNQSQVLDTMDDADNTVSLMLGGIASISLLVGGIGIMNIMLVTVTERTREIGIRKAIGAKRRHILFQFLVEACVLSLFGGLIGVGLSLLGIELYALISSTAMTISWSVATAALAVCVVLGVAFGIYPANKASKLLPIDALRHI
ncbi:MAG: ABC transporter permease [Eubacteriales bacterium]|nr:ABC transporter permease [Eubacteriales bacterium]